LMARTLIIKKIMSKRWVLSMLVIILWMAMNSRIFLQDLMNVSSHAACDYVSVFGTSFCGASICGTSECGTSICGTSICGTSECSSFTFGTSKSCTFTHFCLFLFGMFQLLIPLLSLFANHLMSLAMARLKAQAHLLVRFCTPCLTSADEG
jgi:hypothetical protein